MSAMKGDAPMNLLIQAVADSFWWAVRRGVAPLWHIRAELDATVEEKRRRLDLELMSVCR